MQFSSVDLIFRLNLQWEWVRVCSNSKWTLLDLMQFQGSLILCIRVSQLQLFVIDQPLEYDAIQSLRTIDSMVSVTILLPYVVFIYQPSKSDVTQFLRTTNLDVIQSLRTTNLTVIAVILAYICYFCRSTIRYLCVIN